MISVVAVVVVGLWVTGFIIEAVGNLWRSCCQVLLSIAYPQIVHGEMPVIHTSITYSLLFKLHKEVAGLDSIFLQEFHNRLQNACVRNYKYECIA